MVWSQLHCMLARETLIALYTAHAVALVTITGTEHAAWCSSNFQGGVLRDVAHPNHMVLVHAMHALGGRRKDL